MKRRMHVSTMWESEKFAALSLHARLLMIALIDVCDDQGRFRAHPAWLRSSVFPYDDVRLSDVEGWLQEVAGNETVKLYEVDGQRYGQLVKWWTYQKPQYASPSLLPAPEGWRDRIRQKIGKKILVHNWTDNDGNTLPDTCNARGETPVKTPVSIPIATPGGQATSFKQQALSNKLQASSIKDKQQQPPAAEDDSADDKSPVVVAMERIKILSVSHDAILKAFPEVTAADVLAWGVYLENTNTRRNGNPLTPAFVVGELKAQHRAPEDCYVPVEEEDPLTFEERLELWRYNRKEPAPA